MLVKCLFLISLLAGLSCFAAPAPFELPNELVIKAPQKLRAELKSSKVNTPRYTLAAMKVLEDRIQKRMQLLDFTLNHADAVKGMASSETYRVLDLRIQLTGAERKKIYSEKEIISLYGRYLRSLKVRQEIFKLFRQCTPAMPENRFHSSFFSLLEFQHIYLEQKLLKSLNRRK